MKYIVLVIMSSWVVACSAHDEHYYSLHPDTLQQALKNCPDQQPKGASCEQLKVVAVRVNELVYQLRENPQDYGKQILALQETVAKQEHALKQNAKQPELDETLSKNKQQLKERLAIVKWLESPES